MKECVFMRIDENWDDCFVYIVTLVFPSTSFETYIQTTRTFVLHEEYTKNEFSILLYETFGKSIEVLHFDHWSEGHLFKFY